MDETTAPAPVPPGGAGPSGGIPSRVRWYVAVWAVLAAAVAVVASGSEHAAVGSTAAGLAGALWVAMIVANLYEVHVMHGAVRESATFLEVAALPVMVLLAPPVAAAVTLAAALVSETVITDRRLEKVLFNASWQVAGVSSGAWTFRAISGGMPFDGSALLIAAGVAAGVVFVLINVVALAGVISLLTGVRWYRQVLDELPVAIRDNLGAAMIGLLVVVLARSAPAATPLVLVLALMLRKRHLTRADVYARLAAERDRFHRTVAGSSDAVVLLDHTGRVEVWNPAMVAVTGIAEDRAVGARLGELGWSRLTSGIDDGDDGDDGELRLTIGERVLAVRRAVVCGAPSRTGSTVITVRDVSREAELGRIREDLVMRISHELRTPLTSLEGFLEVLTEHWERLGDDGRRELVAASRRGSRRLARLVANLMVWSGIESRTPDAHHDAPTEPMEVLRDALTEVELRDVRLEADDDVGVDATEEDVRAILVNLLSNAALYGAAPVEVDIRRRGDDVELIVTDAGPGLPAAFRPELFEPFAQATDGLQRTAKGLGLGLAIVRSLATANGGRVRYEDAPARGARFTVTLPAARAQSAPAPRTRASSSSW